MAFSSKMLLLHFLWPRCNQEFANSEDLDEIQHNAAFHQGLHCFVKVKKIFRQKDAIFLEIIT